MQNDFPSSRIERKKKQTMKIIIKTAMELINKQGFNSTTMEQIAEEADIAKATLYNYFSSKEAIVSEYVQNHIRETMSDAIKFLLELPDTRSRIMAVIHEQVGYVKENKEIAEIYLAYRMQMMSQVYKDESIRSGVHILINKIIDLGQEQGEIRQDIPIEILATQLDLIRLVTVMGVLTQSDKFPVEETIANNTDLFLNGAKQEEV